MKSTIHNKKHIFSCLLLVAIFFIATASAFAASPVILYTDVINGPNSGTNDGPGGCYLTLFGKNFGNTRGSSTVTIGGGAVGAYKSWSDTKVSVQLGSSSASGDVILTTSSGSATAPDQFTVNSGDIYFISLSGKDDDGGAAERNNINKTYRTPNHVKELSHFGPGDWIVVLGGTYDLDDGTHNLKYATWYRLYRSGNLNNDIVFMGYPGKIPTLQLDTSVAIFKPINGGGNPWPNYWVFANFYVNVTGGDVSTVMMIGKNASSGICLDDPDASEGAGHGRIVNVELDGKDVGMLEGSSILRIGYSHDIKLLGCSVHNSSTVPPSGSGGYALYLATTQNNTEVGWNKFYNLPYPKRVIQVHQDPFSGACTGKKLLNNIKIHNNEIYNTRSQAILFNGGVGDVWVYNNLVYGTSVNETPYRDILSLRGSDSFNATIYNNTFYVHPWTTKYGVGRLIWFGSIEKNVTLRNNIFYLTEPQDEYFDADTGFDFNKVTSDNNIWYGSNAGLPSFAGPNDKSVDPLFVDPANGNFYLSANSPAIGIGAFGSQYVSLPPPTILGITIF